MLYNQSFEQIYVSFLRNLFSCKTDLTKKSFVGETYRFAVKYVFKQIKTSSSKTNLRNFSNVSVQMDIQR